MRSSDELDAEKTMRVFGAVCAECIVLSCAFEERGAGSVKLGSAARRGEVTRLEREDSTGAVVLLGEALECATTEVLPELRSLATCGCAIGRGVSARTRSGVVGDVIGFSGTFAD